MTHTLGRRRRNTAYEREIVEIDASTPSIVSKTRTLDVQSFYARAASTRRHIEVKMSYVSALGPRNAVALSRILFLFHPSRNKRVFGRFRDAEGPKIALILYDWAKQFCFEEGATLDSLDELDDLELIEVTQNPNAKYVVHPNYEAIAKMLPEAD